MEAVARVARGGVVIDPAVIGRLLARAEAAEGPLAELTP